MAPECGGLGWMVVGAGERRPARDRGPISALLVVFLLGPIVIALLTDPPTVWHQHIGRALVVIVLVLALVASVAAAVVSFLAWLQWSVGRRVKAAAWVHVLAAWVVAVLAMVVLGLTVDWLGGSYSVLMVVAAPMAWLGALGMAVVAIDVARSRGV